MTPKDMVRVIEMRDCIRRSVRYEQGASVTILWGLIIWMQLHGVTKWIGIGAVALLVCVYYGLSVKWAKRWKVIEDELIDTVSR